MKRIITVLSALVMMLACLASCGGREIVGRWEAKVSYKALALGAIDEDDEGASDVLAMFDGLELEYYIEFKPDGNFSAGMEEDSFKDCMKALSERINGYLEQAAQSLNMTLEEFEVQYEKINGEKPQDALDELFVIDEDELITTGPYSVKEDRLYIFFDDEGKINRDAYDTFVIEGDTLTLTERYDFRDKDDRGDSDIEALQYVYPLKLQRVKSAG